jgi:demethylmenaquinone methyltransferase/2-methoxy-6-polyprenyl-1,4-benzoquinol methylase
MEAPAWNNTLATILRDWSFACAPLYEAIASGAAVLAGGERHFRRAAWQNVSLSADSSVLDLCCGPGGATRYLAATGARVTGLDLSERSLRHARERLPGVHFVQGRAEAMPFVGASFDLVHTSVALHEMEPTQRRAIIREVLRVLKPGGTFALIDYHRPTNPLYWPGLVLFLWVFETHTAWELLATDLPGLLAECGFSTLEQQLLAGGSLQTVQARKPQV